MWIAEREWKSMRRQTRSVLIYKFSYRGLVLVKLSQYWADDNACKKILVQEACNRRTMWPCKTSDFCAPLIRLMDGVADCMDCSDEGNACRCFDSNIKTFSDKIRIELFLLSSLRYALWYPLSCRSDLLRRVLSGLVKLRHEFGVQQRRQRHLHLHVQIWMEWWWENVCLSPFRPCGVISRVASWYVRIFSAITITIIFVFYRTHSFIKAPLNIFLFVSFLLLLFYTIFRLYCYTSSIERSWYLLVDDTFSFELFHSITITILYTLSSKKEASWYYKGI